MKKKLLCGVIMAAVITVCAVHAQNVYAIDKNIEIPANPEVEMINVPVIKWDKAKNRIYRVYRSDVPGFYIVYKKILIIQKNTPQEKSVFKKKIKKLPELGSNQQPHG